MARTMETRNVGTTGQRRTRSSVVPAPSSAVTQPQRSDRVLRSGTTRAAADAVAGAKVTKPKRRRRLDPWTPKRKANPSRTPRPRPPPPTHFTCRICIEEQPINEFVRWVPPKRGRWASQLDVPFDCIAHLARIPRRKKIDPVCKTCIGHSMSARLDTLGARQVGTGCLEPGCKNLWNHEYIMRYFPRGEALEKYNMELFDVWLEDATPKPMTCLSPTCSAMGLPDTSAPGFPQVTCHDCSFRACAQCLVPWHEDTTCTEFSAKRIDEKMTDPEKETLELMQTKDGKRCPNCHLVIEKDGGCDSMFCMGCKKYFNWATAASAILGARKALPVIHSSPYWQNQGTVVCEMDRILTGEMPQRTQAVAAAS